MINFPTIRRTVAVDVSRLVDSVCLIYILFRRMNIPRESLSNTYSLFSRVSTDHERIEADDTILSIRVSARPNDTW